MKKNKPFGELFYRSLKKPLLTMRIAVILMILGILQARANDAYSQKTRLSLNFSETELVKVLDKIEDESEFFFLYNEKLLDTERKVDITANDQLIDVILDNLFAGTDVKYTIIDRKIILAPDYLTEVSQTQKFKVSGTITDSKGEAIPGVNVVLKGTLIGANTDIEGKYTIEVPYGNGILVFSFIGFSSQEITINGRSTIDVKLSGEITALTEVVVTALGIKREGKDLTYAIQSFSGDKLNVGKEVNMLNTLQGKVAGLTITKGNEGPGSDSKVLLRGSRSINGNNEPLYVTDGIPSSIGLMNGDNIESITVLKGASAAALYGSAGQNGAIIITTKKGAAGKIAVDYSGGIMFDQVNVLWDRQYEYGQGDFGVYSSDTEHNWGPKTSGQMVTLWNGNAAPYVAERDRLEHFFRTGITMNNSISVSGGSDKMQTYFSYGNIRAQGIMRNNELIRHNFNLKINYDISRKLSFETKLTYSSQDKDNSKLNDAVSSIIRAPITIPLSEIKKYETIDDNGIPRQSYWLSTAHIYLGNPYYYMYKNLNNSKNDRLMGIFTAKYKFTDWLDIQVRGSLDKSFGSGESQLDEDYFGSPIGSTYSMSTDKTQSTNVDFLLSFRHKLSDRFNLSGYLGGSIQDGKQQSINVSTNGLYKPNYFYLSNARAPRATNKDTRSPEVQGIYALTTLTYKNYLFLDITARNDWSSALPKGNESYFYPSFGLNAIVSQMLKLPSWVSYGKARVSLAYSGYGGRAYLGREYYSIGEGGVIITPTIQIFGNYKPEITSSFETGSEWQFVNNRFGINLTYYRTQTKDQLLLIGAPSASLYDQRYINAGLIQNSGVEILANLLPVKTNKFSWAVAINYAKNNNKVIKITDDMKSVILGGGGKLSTVKVVEGAPYGEIYVKAWARDSLGRRLVNDKGAPILTKGIDLRIGNYNPNYKVGLSNTFTYANLSLSFLIDYSNGGIVISKTIPFLDADGLTKRTLEGRENGLILDAYTASGIKNDKSISAQSFWLAVGDRYPTGELYAYSATNMRLRELVLSYSISTNSTKNPGKRAFLIKSVNISIVGRNLFFLQNSAPFDPEITGGSGNEGGLQSGWLPDTRTYGFNVNLSF